MTTTATRELGLGSGQGSAFGDRGIERRLGMLAAVHPPPGGDLLDLGCGPGTYTLRMAADYDSVVGIDIEPRRLMTFVTASRGDEHAGRHVAGLVGSAEDLVFPDESFEAVSAIEVLEHVPDLEACLAEVRRVLVTSGLFMVTTPNRWFPFETHGIVVRGRRWSPGRAPFVTWVRPLHRRLADARAFTRRELVDASARAGLELVGASYMMPPFDRSGVGRRIRRVTDALERSPLRAFGMTHVMVFRRT